MRQASIPVTFIVTGFNQTDLIDEAIAGALAQDYPRLQVILTDDCSSDSTYERMQAAAAAYSGPHKVLVTRPDRNKGTLGNIYHAARQAEGELIVLAGGDDISYPHRTSVLVDHWSRSRADALYSKYDVIDEAGQLIQRDYEPDSAGLWLLDYFPGQKVVPLHGASAAIHRSVVERFPEPSERIRSEDAFWTLMLALHGGRTEYIDRALVRYRKHSGAITNETPPTPDPASIEARERVQMSFAASQAKLLELFRAQLGQRPVSPAVQSALAADLRMFRLRAQWDEAGWTEKLRALPAATRRSQLSWLLPRFGGLALFVRAKSLVLRMRSSQSAPAPAEQAGTQSS
jgi:cellulose synthase/poly-beta-1,6-N-acetylglucosamine synthase-like glycosyltransferase